ncbi:unnamed protein product [Dovyalis caffra]|uniref:Uncharacterized protein n=1 Tax=Dovyalis caffra TaxID=77055 RepID=A0AAV1R0C2_9ROSI|nr:unnamed protein product [Dovyalis caffra]
MFGCQPFRPRGQKLLELDDMAFAFGGLVTVLSLPRFVCLQTRRCYLSSHDDRMAANNSRDPPRCPGTRCLISSKAHNVSESRPPANCGYK